MSDKGEGCLSGIAARIIMLLVVGGVLALFASTFIAQDLEGIDGYTSGQQTKSNVDVSKLLDRAIKERRKVSFSEKQVNEYLGQHLTVTQGGPLANFGTKAKAVWVQFYEGKMELIIEREVFGFPHTVSLFLTFSQELDSFGKETMIMRRTGGKFGVINVAPGYLFFVQEGFNKIAACMEEKLLNIVGEMQEIRFEDGSIMLDPTLPEMGL